MTGASGTSSDDARRAFPPTLAGRYVVDRVVARGSTATLYLARHVQLDVRRAIKVFDCKTGASMGASMFRRLMEELAPVQDHATLLRLYEVGETDGRPFSCTAFADDGSLRARLDRDGPVPLAEAVQIAKGVARALDHLHGHHVLHGNLKPENIFLPADQPRVGDIGIRGALARVDGTRPAPRGLVVGIPRPEYMAPEYVRGDQQLDGGADVYALGAVLYELLTGTAPAYPPTVWCRIVRAAIPGRRRWGPVAALNALVPSRVAAAVARALAPNREDRFATAGAFAAELGT